MRASLPPGLVFCFKGPLCGSPAGESWSLCLSCPAQLACSGLLGRPALRSAQVAPSWEWRFWSLKECRCHEKEKYLRRWQ